MDKIYRKKIGKEKRTKENKKRLSIIIGIIIFLVLVGVISFGYYGGKQSRSLTVVCDIGWENTLCWKWHKALDLNDILRQFGAKI